MTRLSSTKRADREFLFEYRFAGADWSFCIFAADPAEAREKIKAVGLARYKGEVAMKIPASVPGAGFLVSAILRIKNWRLR